MKLIMSNLKKIFKNIKLFPREEFRETNLPEKEKKMLCEEGLPDIPLHFLHFYTQADALVYVDGDFISIGNDNGMEICISPNNEIISVDAYGVYPRRFVNSNLECLFECVSIYLTYSDRLTVADDDEASMLIGEIRQKFNLVDERALNDEENWWSYILEQAEYG